MAHFNPAPSTPYIIPAKTSPEILAAIPEGPARSEAARLLAGVQSDPVQHLCACCLECDPPEFVPAVVTEVDTREPLCDCCDEIAADV